jgi:hypothetical protein
MNNLRRFKKTFAQYNSHLLVNENVIFTKQNRTINIIGIDDFLQGTPDFTTATKTIKLWKPLS